MIVRKKTFVIFLLVLTVLLLVYSIYIFRAKVVAILIPFVLAIIISYSLKPLVTKLESKKIPCSLSIILIYLLFTLCIIVSTVFIIPELISNTKELIDSLPELTNKYQNIVKGYMSHIQSSKWSPEIKNAILQEIQNGSNSIQNFIMDNLSKALNSMVKGVTIILDLTLSMLIAYYMIKDSKIFRETFLSLTPRKWRNGLINTGREVNMVLSNFIQGQLMTALIVGILESIGLFIVHVKYPLVLGFIGGIANVIPYFGPFLGCIPAVALALIDSPVKAFWVIVVFIVVQQIDNAFISPKIIEGKLGLHPLTTILAVLIGGEFFGIVGMLISVPIFAIVKVVIKRSVESIV